MEASQAETIILAILFLLANREDGVDEIRLLNGNVNSSMLGTLIEFLFHYLVEPMPEIERPFGDVTPLVAELVPQWYADFINVEVEQDRLFELASAAFYMEIEPLMDLTCATVATMFNGLTLGQMTQLLGTIRLHDDETLRVHNILTRVGKFLYPGSFGVFYVVANLARNPGAPIPFPNGGLIYDV